MIKLIYFDFFNVLCNPPLTPTIKKIIPQQDQQKYIDKLDELDLGNISFEDFIEEMSQGSGMSPEEINKEVDSIPKLDKDLLDFISNLKKHYRIGLFTNAINTTIYKLLGDNIELFDIKLISSEVKLIKPDTKIFELAIKLSGVTAEEILFIDDNKVNIDAANSMNINTIIYTDYTDFIKQINKTI